MPKRYLLIDNDNTLMDFDLAERRALLETLHAWHLPEDEATVAAYHRINAAQWKALERGETTQSRLKRDRFQLLLEALGRTDLDAQAVCDSYNLGAHAELLPGAMELLQALHGRMKLALVSNGISAIQRSRLSLSPMTPYFDAVIISEEVGVSKPDPRMVELALDALGCADRAEAVFLGDSLTADIAAAKAAGIDSIWLRSGSEGSGDPTWTVGSLGEARELLEKLS